MSDNNDIAKLLDELKGVIEHEQRLLGDTLISEFVSSKDAEPDVPKLHIRTL